MTVSVVIATFNRNVQLAHTLASIRSQNVPVEIVVVDDGDGSHGHPSAALVCHGFGAKHIKVNRPKSVTFRNPSYPNNVGIRAATGTVVILQNAECKHVGVNVIEKLTALVNPNTAAFAHVVALREDGTPLMDYCSPSQPRPYFFCGAVLRETLLRIRGFDEDYTGAGYDDDDLAIRLAGEGVEFVYSDALVHHQWHPPAGVYADAEDMKRLYNEKCAAMMCGDLGTVRNIGKTWGGQP